MTNTKITEENAHEHSWADLAKGVARKIAGFILTPGMNQDAVLGVILTWMVGRHGMSLEDTWKLPKRFPHAGDPLPDQDELKKLYANGFEPIGIGKSDRDEHGRSVDVAEAAANLSVHGQTDAEMRLRFVEVIDPGFYMYPGFTTARDTAWGNLEHLRTYTAGLDQHAAANPWGLSYMVKQAGWMSFWELKIKPESEHKVGTTYVSGRDYEPLEPNRSDPKRVRLQQAAANTLCKDMAHIMFALVWRHVTCEGPRDIKAEQQHLDRLFVWYLVTSNLLRRPVYAGPNVTSFHETTAGRAESHIPGDTLRWVIREAAGVQFHSHPRVNLVRKSWIARLRKRLHGTVMTTEGVMDLIHAEALEGATENVAIILTIVDQMAEQVWLVAHGEWKTEKEREGLLNAMEEAWRKAKKAAKTAKNAERQAFSALAKHVARKGQKVADVKGKEIADWILKNEERVSGKAEGDLSRWRTMHDAWVDSQLALERAKRHRKWARRLQSRQERAATTLGETWEEQKANEAYYDRSPLSPYSLVGIMRALLGLATYRGPLPHAGISQKWSDLALIMLRLISAQVKQEQMFHYSKVEAAAFLTNEDLDEGLLDLPVSWEGEKLPGVFAAKATHCPFLEKAARMDERVAATVIGSAARPGRWSVAPSSTWMDEDQGSEFLKLLMVAWRLSERLVRELPWEKDLPVLDENGDIRENDGLTVLDEDAYPGDPVFPAQNGDGDVHHLLIGGSLRHDRNEEGRSKLDYESHIVPLVTITCAITLLPEEQGEPLKRKLLNELMLATPTSQDGDWDAARRELDWLLAGLEGECRRVTAPAPTPRR